MDDYYEYRHVILPKEVYKKLPRGKLLTESVSKKLCRNGDRLEYSNREAGSTTNCIDHNPIFCSLEDPRDQILKLGSLLQASLLPLIPSPIENDHLMHLI